MRKKDLQINGSEGHSISSDRLDDTGIWILRNAIVEQAVRDWRFSTQKVETYQEIEDDYGDDTDGFYDFMQSYGKGTGNRTHEIVFIENQRLKKECEHFFLSNWFEILTDLDGAWILGRLEAEDRSKKTYVRKYRNTQ